VTDNQYTLIEEDSKIESAAREIARHPVLGVDTETTGLDPYTSRVRLLQISTPERVFIFDLFKTNALADPALREILSSSTATKVLHHAKFDMKMLLHHFNLELRNVFDTLLASQILSAGRSEGSHGLAGVVERYLGSSVDKTQQASDWSKDLSDIQYHYAAKDAALLLPLRERLEQKIIELGLEEAARIEFECALPLAAMEIAGMPLDTDCWRKLVAGVERAHEILSTDLRRELAAGVQQMTLFGEAAINLDSPAQIIDALTRMGIKVEGTRNLELQPLADKYPVVRKLLEYRSVQKALSSYGASILDHVHRVTGRIHSDFHQIGATGGRMSCSNPNLQQIPNTPEYRSCFRAPAGRKIVTADYSQIELRILADWSQDTALVKALMSGEDLHSATASQMFDVPIGEVTKDQRAAAKQLNYGLMYGLGAQGLAARIDCSVEEAEGLIRKYFAAYSGVAAWLRDAADRAVHDRQTRTRAGRLIYFTFDAEDRAQVAATQRLGKNVPLQGSNADILKRALSLLYDALKRFDARIVNCVHDEIVVEVAESEAEECARAVEREMVAAARQFIRSIPVSVDATIGDAWLK
jgi:DNA polymerase I-like protein with 3'-5' exonuclease and polymerase domains